MKHITVHKDIEIISRGLIVLFPEPVNPKAIAVMRQKGIILDNRTSVALTEEDIPEGAILYPSRKDDTDMMLAVKKALAIGAKEIWMFGGLGGRLDHSYANIQTLAYLLEYGVSGVLMDENHRVSMIADGQREKMSLAYHYLSVFAYGGVCTGVNITGAEYLLEDATLTPSFPLGCSNRHAPGEQMEVSVEHGTLLLIQTKLN